MRATYIQLKGKDRTIQKLWKNSSKMERNKRKIEENHGGHLFQQLITRNLQADLKTPKTSSAKHVWRKRDWPHKERNFWCPWGLIRKIWPSLKLTASLPLQMDSWNTILSYWVKGPIFRGELAVSFREGSVSAWFISAVALKITAIGFNLGGFQKRWFSGVQQWKTCEDFDGQKVPILQPGGSWLNSKFFDG